MIANAALFLLGAVQHVGVVIGPLSEPTIIPAAFWPWPRNLWDWPRCH